MNIKMTKDMISMKYVIVTISLLGSIIGGTLFIEDRYAKAADFTSYKTEISAQLIQGIDGIRIKQLEEKIFIINYKIQTNKATPLDKALLQRYKQELISLRNNH